MSLRALYDVAAPAKLNLFLHVVGRRADGYHLLQSVFVLIDWFDTLHFELRPDGRLERHDLGDALPEDDLCLRAARALRAQSCTPHGVDISILKRVPSGAGMGGGSSDAASTLLALNRLWGLNWPKPRLAALGLTLGADVPFFIGGRNAFVEGIGEKIAPIALATEYFAVIKPAEGMATPAIFADPALVRDTETVILEGLSASLAERFGRNDLQPVATAKCVEIGRAAAWLEARFGNSRMTGSGSAVFARVGPAEGLALELRSVPAWPEAWSGRMCRGLEVHPLCGWAADLADS